MRYLIGTTLIDEEYISLPRAEPHPTTFERTAWHIRGDSARVRNGWGRVTWFFEGQYLTATQWNQYQSLIGADGYGEVYIRTRTDEMTAGGEYQYEVYQAIMSRPQGRPIWGERYAEVSIEFLLVENPAEGYDPNTAVNVTLFPGWEPSTSTSTTSTSTTISSTSSSTSMTSTSTSTTSTSSSTSTTSTSTSTTATSITSTSTTSTSTSTTMTSITSTSTTSTTTSTTSTSSSTSTTLGSPDELSISIDEPISMAIDETHGYLYVGSMTSPGEVTAIRLSDFTEVKTITLLPGENFLYGLAIDVDDEYLYASTYTAPSIIVRIGIIVSSLDEFVRIDALTLS